MIPLIGLLSPIVGKILDKIPDAGAKEKARLEFELAIQENELKIMQMLSQTDVKQAEINIEEAKSSNWFISSWRPGVAWVCVAAFTWAYVLQPIVVFIVVATGHPLVGLPEMNMGEMMPVLLGLLGLSGLRSFEKTKGVAK